MNVYRVEKKEQPIVLFQADGSVMNGVVFLSPSAYNHVGQQTLEDLLREEGDFFPFRSDDGAFCVTNKNSITHIRFIPIEKSEMPVIGDEIEVQIIFVGGEKLAGKVLIQMPEGRTRLFDFINSTEMFFLLENQEAHYLVNVKQIRDVSPKG